MSSQRRWRRATAWLVVAGMIFVSGAQGCYAKPTEICWLDLSVTAEICGGCFSKVDLPADIVDLRYKVEIFEEPLPGQSLTEAKRVLFKAWSYPFDMSCRGDHITYPGEWDPKVWRHSSTLLRFGSGICRDRGRLTVIATLCDPDPETGWCRFGKDDIEVVVEWQGGEDLVAPEDEWIDAPDRHLSVKICP